MNIIMKSGRTFGRDVEYYLAGPMTGLPEYNYPAFEKAEVLLAENGITVRSPHRIDHQQHTFVGYGAGGTFCDRILSDGRFPAKVCRAGKDDAIHNTERGSLPYSVYLKAGYRLLLECGGIIMLHGWTQSRGTRHELYVARSLGYPVFAMGEGYLMELQSDEG